MIWNDENEGWSISTPFITIHELFKRWIIHCPWNNPHPIAIQELLGKNDGLVHGAVDNAARKPQLIGACGNGGSYDNMMSHKEDSQASQTTKTKFPLHTIGA